MVATPQLDQKILRRQTSPDQYRVYRAGLEWDLTDPIIIESRDDLKSEYRWHDRLEPYHHQVTNLITFCRRLPVTLLADDVGLGKTISAGLVLSELISRARVSKVLIVCPKLLGPQWKEELETKFDIPAEIAIGRKLLSAEPEEIGAVITTYASARLHLDRLPEDRFQMLILDEAHKLRNLYGTDATPQVALRFRKALEDRRFPFVLMLTATPIHNRLWDLYSLVDLLTVARGHQNPFGSEGAFARKFIADDREKARKLKPESSDEFRSIVYGYMSRVRRGDARLYFPERVVQMHRVVPTPAELQLITTIAKPIQKLDRRTQISILQALVSSPDAVSKQLMNMAQKGTVPHEVALAVRSIVTTMPTCTKLVGLGALIEKLRREKPKDWRAVIFTTRLETQTTIETYLSERGLKVGIINGSSGPRNQDTLARFRKNPPDCYVIVSTEAGAEGINLQVANVLVNFDLPWNPMIVEQRIGRVQRLASEHASVIIFNIMLAGTFEEYIVGRLMEKLQMASHAIGDVEALLEASGIGEEEEGEDSFEEKIRILVLAALAGKDVAKAMRLAEQSIEDAKVELEHEQATIGEMLGSMDGAEYVGPQAPKLPEIERSMAADDFVLAALRGLGARLTEQGAGLWLAEEAGGREHIRFEGNGSVDKRSVLYARGTPAFARLVRRAIASGVCVLNDDDTTPGVIADEMARGWVSEFGGVATAIAVEDVERCFSGNSLVRVRATVAHDSYERLVEVPCAPADHHSSAGKSALGPLAPVVDGAAAIGIDPETIVQAAQLDPAIAEFSRFYLERRDQEMMAAGDDARKRKKLEDEFTPQLTMGLVGVDGNMHRHVRAKVRYRLDGGEEYSSVLRILPSARKITDAPEFATCAKSARRVPRECLGKCEITGAAVILHLLTKSEISGRMAQPEFAIRCGLSGKRILQDEAEISAVTGQMVARALLKTSGVSGKRAEPDHFGRCDFTTVEALKSELATSDLSSRPYRLDQQARSAVSGKAGHSQEFLSCYETRLLIAATEAEQCGATGHKVRPGVLEVCAVTGQRVLPSELERCAITGKRMQKRFLVTSSVSQTRFLEEVAVRSASGALCTPAEAKRCVWSGRKVHPDDIRVCELVGLPVHSKFTSDPTAPRLQPLIELLNGVTRTAEETRLWPGIAEKLTGALHGARCQIDASMLSPDGQHLAATAEVRTLLGLRVQRAGLVYSLQDRSIAGRVALGKLKPTGWHAVRR